MSNSAPRRSITVGWSLFLAFAMLVLVTSGATLALVMFENERTRRAQTGRQIARSQDRIELELRQLFDPIVQAVVQAKRWTQRGLVKRYDSEALKALFLPGMRLLPQSCSMMVSDMSGYEFLILRNLGPGGLLETSAEEGAWILRDFRRDAWGTRSLWSLWDVAGKTKIRSWEKELDYDPRSRVWHAGPRRLAKTPASSADPASGIYWTDVDIFFTSKTSGITASIAAKDPSGAEVVIGYDLLFSDLSRFTQALRPTPNGKVMVLTEDGKVVGLPRDARLVDPQVLAKNLLKPVEEIGVPELTEGIKPWRARSSDQVGPFRFQSEGETWWLGMRPFRISPQRRLWIGVALPEADLNPREREAMWLVGIGLLALVAAFGLAGLLSRRFADSINQLVAQSKRIADLDLSPTGSGPSRLTEIRQLSRVLDETGSALAQHIEERRLAEEARHETEDKYRRLIENMPESYFFYAHDAQGMFTYISPSITQVMGYTPEEFLTHYTEYLTDSPLNEAVERYTELALQGIQQPPYELEIRHKDGSLRRLEALETPLSDAAGSVKAVEGIAHDVTSVKQAERELKEAKERAEAATQAKSRFLAVVSHELRTPLNAVLGLTRLMQDTGLTQEQREYADTIRESGSALLSLVNDILDFSKIESEKLELEQVHFRLSDCMEASIHLVEARAKGRGLSLRWQAEDDVPTSLVGDGTRVRQVLVNLLSNAIKFTREGEIVVDVSARPVQDDQLEVQWSVRDTGIGIPAERFDRLFESFSQVDASTTRKYGGTGLGLAICKRLSEAMGGAIWVESKVGVGSTFHFTIVARAGSAEPEPTPVVSRDPVFSDLASSKPLRIHVADDDAVSRRLVRRFLEKMGYQVDVSSDGREALEAILRESYDLVFLDVQMPELDGLQVARQVLAATDGDRPRLVAMTAGAMEDDREACLEAGMDDYVSKPVEPEALRAVLEVCPRREA